MGRGSARRSSLKGQERAIINQTNIETVSKATLGKPLRETGWSAYGLFQVHRYHLELVATACNSHTQTLVIKSHNSYHINLW